MQLHHLVALQAAIIDGAQLKPEVVHQWSVNLAKIIV